LKGVDESEDTVEVGMNQNRRIIVGIYSFSIMLLSGGILLSEGLASFFAFHFQYSVPLTRRA
jgi:hypothetical protein